jgi:hypothetical protein
MTRPRLEYGGTEFVCLVKSDLPHELASLFAEMNGKDQAEFFSFLAVQAERWEKPACFQWRDMVDNMDRDAKLLLSDMADQINERV